MPCDFLDYAPDDLSLFTEREFECCVGGIARRAADAPRLGIMDFHDLLDDHRPVVFQNREDAAAGYLGLPGVDERIVPTSKGGLHRVAAYWHHGQAGEFGILKPDVSGDEVDRRAFSFSDCKRRGLLHSSGLCRLKDALRSTAVQRERIVDLDERRRQAVVLGRFKGGAKERVLEEMREVDSGDGVEEGSRLCGRM
jgi:hypothetical protein